MVDLAASISHSSPTLSPLRAALQACISTLQLSLPPLKDFATWRTHTSYHGVVHDAFERPQGMPVWDYERREHVGDIVLGYYVTRLIDQRYPGLVVGMRSLLRSLLVSNSLLSALSSHLGLPQHLLAAEAQLQYLQTNYRVQAALFEAYLGTLDLEQPRSAVEQFVEEVFGRLVVVGYEGLKEVFREPIPMHPQMQPEQAAGGGEGGPPRPFGGGVDDLPPPPTPPPVINYVGKMMEWASARGHAHQRSVTFRKLSPSPAPSPSPTPSFSDFNVPPFPLSATTPGGNGPQVTSSEYELEWRDLGAMGDGAEELRRGMKVRGEGRTVKVAKAVAAHQACSLLGI